MKYKFVIISPRQKSGGGIVLHVLCKYLTELGYDASVFYTQVCDYKKVNKKNRIYLFNKNLYLYLKGVIYWLRYIKFFLRDLLKLLAVKILPKNLVYINGFSRQPVKGCKRKWTPFIDKNTIVVYPEVIYGNPLHAQKVVRWFLYYNRYKDDAAAYGVNDLFYCYREIFNDAFLNPKVRVLRTAYYDLDFYKQFNFDKRSGKCYIIRKGKNREDLPEKFDGIIIDDLLEKEKVKVFNSCEYCISYDTQTAYSGLASICGCISVIVPEPGKEKKDYLGENEKSYGVAWGFEKKELEFAVNTRNERLELCKELNQAGRRSVEDFIDVCNQYFI